MSLLHYIDNEVPDFGEWSSVVRDTESNVQRSALAAWPDRGSYGVRIASDSTERGYVTKDLAVDLDPGESIFVGFWLKPQQPSNVAALDLFEIDTPSGFGCGFRTYSSAGWQCFIINDVGALSTVLIPLTTNTWMYIVVELRRASSDVASDGGVKVYRDGYLSGSSLSVDNYDRAAQIIELRIGVTEPCGLYNNNEDFDFDEVKIATTYPEPYAPTPADEYPSARRTVVVVPASTEGRDFADFCIDNYSVPRSNICYLPNASATESLADYATWQTQVEDDLADFFARNPTIADNCTCFLLGQNTPGYFLDETSGGKKHSAVSRMMNYGTAFSSQTDNPLYAPATVTRLTKTSLRAAGVYLATRIDSNREEEYYEAIFYHTEEDVSALAQIPDDDYLVAESGNTYIASPAAGKLRIKTLGTDGDPTENVCFYTVNGSAPQPADQGVRAAYIERANYVTPGGETLRGADSLHTKLYTNGYAAGIAFSDDADGVDLASFFEMLRIGGTFAEACMVALEHVDFTAVCAGFPLWTIRFQLGGYNVYSGYGSRDAIDYTTQVGATRPGVVQLALTSADYANEADHYFALRAVSSAGVEETNTQRFVRVRKDAEGALVGPAPAALVTASVAQAAGGYLTVSFTYSPTSAVGVATTVQVARGAGWPLVWDWDTPEGTASVAARGRTSGTVTVGPYSDGETVHLAIRAVTAGAVAGPVMVLNVIAADAVGPAEISYVAAEQMT